MPGLLCILNLTTYSSAVRWTVLCTSLSVLLLLVFTHSASAADTAILRLTIGGTSYVGNNIGWSPDGAHLLYFKQCQADQQLWLSNADGTDAKAISKIGQIATYSWSPDSKKIGYSYAEKDDPQTQATLYLYDLATQQNRQLTTFKWGLIYNNGWDQMKWMKDAKAFLLLMRRTVDDGNRLEVYLYDAETGRATGLTPNSYTTGVGFPASLSPDGTQIALASQQSADANRRLWICNSDGSKLHPVTPADMNLIEDPAWSPQGDWIAFDSTYDRLEDEKKFSQCDYWLVHTDGSALHKITHGSSPSKSKRITYGKPQWTADGRYLLCMTNKFNDAGTGFGGMWLLEVATGAFTRILENDPNSDQVIDGYFNLTTLSADGKYIAIAITQSTVHGRDTGSPIYQDRQDIVYYYDISSQTLHEVQRTHPDTDGFVLLPSSWDTSGIPSFSQDSRRLLFAKFKVISMNDKKFEPDLYTLQLTSATVQPPVATSVPPPVILTAPATVSTFAPRLAVLIRPQNRTVTEIAESLPQSYTGMYRVDQGLNALVVTAPDENTLQRLQCDVQLLDQATPQIMADVLVAELSRDGSKQLGLNWEFARGQMGATLPLLPSGDAGNIIFQGVGTLDRQFFATLSALAEQGKAIVRANPRILSRAGTEATINIRSTKNFLFVSGTDSQGNPVKQRSDISADIILKILPRYIATGKIIMTLDATVDSFVFGKSGDLPDTTRRQAITNTMVGDGETVIIGGLTTEEETRTLNKTPLIGDLPLVGTFFQTTNQSKKETTLVIFVTPHVVTKAGNGILGVQPLPPLHLFKYSGTNR